MICKAAKEVNFMQRKIRNLVYTAMMAALVAVATLFIHIPIPMQSGYCNLGDALILSSGALLGPWAAISAAIGSALADLLLGYAAYAPVTAVIKGLMGLIAGICCARKKNAVGRALWMVAAELIMVAGYFLFETALYGAAGAAGSLLGNGCQAVVGLLVGCGVWPLMGRIKKMIP